MKTITAPQPASGDKWRTAYYAQVRIAGPDERSPSGKPYDLEIVVSTGTTARDGGVILPTAWAKDLSSYRKNPVIQWAHDYSMPPIALAVDTKPDRATGELKQWWRFLTGISADAWDSFAGRIKALYAAGGMNAASVGWLTLDARPATTEEREKAVADGKRLPYWVVTRGELLEVSAVPVPSDPDAIAVERAIEAAQAKGINVKDVAAAWDHLTQHKVESDFLRQAGAEFFRNLAEHRVVVPVAWMGGIAFEREEPAPAATVASAADTSATVELEPAPEPATVAPPAVEPEPELELEPEPTPEPERTALDALLHDLEGVEQLMEAGRESDLELSDFLDDAMAGLRSADPPPSTPTPDDSDELDPDLIRTQLRDTLLAELGPLLRASPNKE